VSDKCKHCAFWIVDVAYQLGRASELVDSDTRSAKSLASLSSFLLQKEVKKCIDVKEIRKKISEGVGLIGKGDPLRAYNALSSAKHSLAQKAKNMCV